MGNQLIAPVLTDVVKAPYLLIVTADENERFFAQIMGNEVTGLPQFFYPWSRVPNLAPQVGPLTGHKFVGAETARANALITEKGERSIGINWWCKVFFVVVRGSHELSTCKSVACECFYLGGQKGQCTFIGVRVLVNQHRIEVGDTNLTKRL